MYDYDLAALICKAMSRAIAAATPTDALAMQTELDEAQRKQFADHATAPFCWLELPDGTKSAMGGRDGLCAWAKAEFPESPEVQKLASGAPATSEAFFDKGPGTAARS